MVEKHKELKLSKELSKKDTGNTLAYLNMNLQLGFDFADVDILTKVLHHLVELGNSVLVVIEQNL